MTATWQPNPYSPDEVEGLVDDDGSVIALVEDFGYACYPSAINASTGNRGTRWGLLRPRRGAPVV
jgi:hypothetical protein